MINFFTDYLYEVQLLINFFAYLAIFIGTFYVALQNRKLPSWHTTPLWYVGLSSLFIAITITLQGMFGREFALSYANAGIWGESALNLSLAYIATVMLVGTIRRDLQGKVHRK